MEIYVNVNLWYASLRHLGPIGSKNPAISGRISPSGYHSRKILASFVRFSPRWGPKDFRDCLLFSEWSSWRLPVYMGSRFTMGLNDEELVHDVEPLVSDNPTRCVSKGGQNQSTFLFGWLYLKRSLKAKWAWWEWSKLLGRIQISHGNELRIIRCIT